MTFFTNGFNEVPPANEQQQEQEQSNNKGKAKEKDTAEKQRFEVKKWNAVALWAWDIVVLNVKQIKLQQHAKCTVAWGICNVSIHIIFIYTMKKRKKRKKQAIELIFNHDFNFH
ncbi:unnamed protein product [Cunninghamella blakesleeana]